MIRLSVSASAEPHREPPPWRLSEALSRAVLRRRGHSDPAIIEILEPAPAPPPEQHFPDLPKPWNGSTRRGWACLVTVDNGISARPALEQD